MKSSKLKSVFVPAPEEDVRSTLAAQEVSRVPEFVDADAPQAKQLVAEGALALIPAEGGVVVAGDLPASLEQALGELSPPA